MALQTDQFDDNIYRRTMEMLERFREISAMTTAFERPILIDNILGRAGIITPQMLKTQSTGIKNLVELAAEVAKNKIIYPDNYISALDSLFPKVDFLKYFGELQVRDYNFFPETLPSTIEVYAEVPKIERIIGAICTDNQKLYEIHPDDMEELVAEMLHKEGWEIKLTKKTRDGGYDMLALQQIGGIEFKMIAEVKRWAKNRKVGVEIIRGFQSVIINKGVNKGVLFTSSSFTKDAKNYQNEYAPHLMALKDYNDIIGWIENIKP